MANQHTPQNKTDIRALWEKGGRFHKIWPLFDAFDTFLFSIGHRTQKGPHIRDANDLKRVMSVVIAAMIPATLFGIWNIGAQSRAAYGLEPDFWISVWAGLWTFIPLLVISYGVGMGWEFLFAIWRKEEVSEGYLVTGWLIPLIVPPTIPWWQLIIAVSFGVIIGKEVFGGTGMNIVNPALITRAFLFFTYPGQISGDSVWVNLEQGRQTVDAFTGATPLALGAASREMGLNAVTAITQHYSFMDCLIGTIPGSIGETSKIAILLGAAILLITGIASWRVMVSSILGLSATVWGLRLIGDASAPGMVSLPVLHHLVMGGFLFGIVFMATDPVTHPETRTGKWVFGFLVGVITALVRVVNPAYPEGTMLAILLLNVFSPLIDYIVVQFNVRARRMRYAQ